MASPPRLTSLRTTGVPGLPDTEIPLFPVTAIVGPRGSGKSRLLAALAWLLTGAPDLADRHQATRLRVSAAIEDASGRRTVERDAGHAPAGPLPPTMLLLAGDRLPPGPPVQPGQPE